ncbi:MAG: YdeI/OmpD-associated family protein [Candidatus Magasanikbacteria bacterium]|nr:YdeI/OmpD-associated family protein [Candidatus Magasanikbacteria bacterium]
MNKVNQKPSKKEPETKVPLDLRRALSNTPKAEALWQDLTPIARRDFISWIESAKQAETRSRRVAIACSKLIAGKRRPCCYSVIPMDLYKALGTNPQAKAQWSNLAPNERRDFANWVDAATKPEVRKQAIEKVCQMLIKGKRGP